MDSVNRLGVLYICYLALDEPLVETQVVAYLEGLAARGHIVHLMTFENSRLSRQRRLEFRQKLNARGVHWHCRRYHKRPSLLATGFDVVIGTLVSGVIVRRNRLNAIHARSHVPAAMALVLKRIARVPFIFDIRGLMAEEYVDAGRWAPGGVPFRVTKAVERAAIRHSIANVVLTERVRDFLFPGLTDNRHQVIPCCADTDRIAAQRGCRDRVREELGLRDRLVLIYVGKFSGWYMEREMVEFFVEARKQRPHLHFHILTQHDRDPIIRELRRAGVGEDGYSIAQVPPEGVAAHLAAADAAIAFIRPCPSKVSSSPTKIGEYLAAGLPIVTSAGIGDVDELVGRDGIGVLVERFDRVEYGRAAKQLWAAARDLGAADRRMSVAEERLSLRRVGIPAYDALYRAAAAEISRLGGRPESLQTTPA